jgi:hypothetical protein
MESGRGDRGARGGLLAQVRRATLAYLGLFVGGVAGAQRSTKACGKRKKSLGRKCNVLQVIEITIAVVDGGLLCSGLRCGNGRFEKLEGSRRLGRQSPNVTQPGKPLELGGRWSKY